MSDRSATIDIEYYVDCPQDEDRIRAAANWIAANVAQRPMQCSVSIVDDPQIREVNRDSLEHDWETDVVSFVIEANDAFVDGEVIASFDTASRLAEKAGWKAVDELLLYVVHGMLHVAGLDDIADDERRTMRAKEVECLTAIGVDAQHLPERWDEVV